MTSELARSVTEVKVPDENEASERRHEARCREVQVLSDDEGDVQRGNEAGEGSAAKPARVLGAPTTGRSFFGGEVAAHEPLGVCPRKHEEKSRTRRPGNAHGYIEVLGHRQIVFKSDQENPVKAVQRELAVRDGRNTVQRVMRLTRVSSLR